MTRRRVIVTSVALAISLGAGTALAAAPKQWERTAQRLGLALKRELGLAKTATELHEAVAALERERLGIDYDAAILNHAGRQSMRQLDAYRAGRAERHAQVATRARAMYKLSRGGMLRFAFEEPGTEHAMPTEQRISMGRSLRWLVRHDLVEMSAYQRAEVRAEAELLSATRELQALSALATVQTMQGRVLDDAKEIVTPALQRAAQQRRKIARSGRSAHRARLAQRKLQREVSRHWKRLNKLTGIGTKGKLIRPVRGKVAGAFGEYEDPVLRLPMQRHGVELAARSDEQVRAIDEGQVALVSRLPGFDDVVVVDHGAGQLSMTGRLWKVAVREGDEIEAGAVLGRVAPKAVDDGLGSTVYLEIRHGESPVDPAPYLRKASRRR